MKIKASIFPVWDPWDGNPPEFDDIYVSISIDSIDFDDRADVKILYMVEPNEVLPHIKKKALSKGDNFDIIYTTDQDIIDIESGNSFPNAMIISKLENALNVRLTPI